MFSKVMLLVFGAFVVGVVVTTFVFSQGPGLPFPITPPASGAYHTADQIVCNGCVTSSSLAPDSVTSGKILDGEIIDQDVSFGAAINPQKINGINGFYSIVTNTLFSAPLDLPFSESWGISSWVGKRLETICDPGISSDITALDGTIDFTGLGQYYARVFNHYTTVIWTPGSGSNLGGSLGNGWSQIYQADTKTVAAGSTQGSRNLYIRVNPADSSKLQIGQTTTGTGYGLISSWRCLVKFVS